MTIVAGVFASWSSADRAIDQLRGARVAADRINLLGPGADASVADTVATVEAEPPGVGKAIGGVVGGAAGAAGGAALGMAVAMVVVPGIGPVLALGAVAAALLGAAGATAGSAVVGSIEAGATAGLPVDEVYVYEDALRRGRTVLLIAAGDDEEAEGVREVLARAGAESIDAARQRWWLGLRDAEREHYTVHGGEPDEADEILYRRGFEAALQGRGRTTADVADLERRYGEDGAREAFRRGYERGRAYRGPLLPGSRASTGA